MAVDPSLFCGKCRQCRAGRFNLCENWNAIGVVSANGACAEFVAVDTFLAGSGLKVQVGPGTA